MYKHTKNREAPFVWSIRVVHPMLTSREMWMILENAMFVSAV